MTRARRIVILSGMAAAAMAMPAWAEVPAAMDRVPADALMAASIRNLGQFQTKAEGLATMFGADPEGAEFAEAMKYLNIGGLNKDGSVAFVILPPAPGAEPGLDEEEGEEGDAPPMVVILPVKDFATLSKSLGGDGQAFGMVSIEQEPGYLKDLGGGYAALGPVEEVVRGFAGTAGQKGTHEKALGKTGNAVADASDMLFVANIPALAPMIEAGFEQMKEQMEGLAAMTGQAQLGNMAAMEAFVETYIRDASVGVMGVKSGESGISFDLATQFKEGSQTAGVLTDKGSAHTLLNRLPNKPFLFAFAADLSGAGMKKIVGDMIEMTKQADPQAAELAQGLNLMGMIRASDGVAYLVGTSPAGLFGGGLFANTVQYFKTSEPAELVKTLQEGATKLNGQEISGTTYQTTYQTGATTVAGTPVDAWSMRMKFDPNNPAAQQIQQAQGMLFGPAGLAGFIAPAVDGVVITLSKNTALLGEALAAAQEAKGLGTDASLTAITRELPADRTMESFVSVKGILDMVVPLMSMMMGPMDFEVPAELPPVATGATTRDGGFRMTTFIPMEVLQTVRKLMASMEALQGQGMEEDAPEEEEGAGQPRF